MQALTNSEVGDLPKYNEIHVDHEVSITSSPTRSTISRSRPKYSITPIVYSPSESSQSEYSQSSHGQESPATSIERSSDPVSEETITNLAAMLIPRDASFAKHDNGGTRELADFLLACEPPPNNFMSTPGNINDVNRKGTFKIFARRKARRSKSVRHMRLPASAVAATTTHGARHIAIVSIQEEHENSELVSQYQYHAPVNSPEPQSRPVQKLQKSPPSNSNSSIHVNAEHSLRGTEPPTATQSNSLAVRSRESCHSPTAIGADDAKLLQKFWEQHPSPEKRHGLSGSNRNVLSRLPEEAQRSPGRQGSEMTDPRHSGGTAYSERTLGTTTVSGSHSRDSSGNSNSSKHPFGAKMRGNHPPRTSSMARVSNQMPVTSRQFPLIRPESRNGTAKTVALEAGPSETSSLSTPIVSAATHNGDNDLILPSGFLASSPYSSHKPPQPGPAPNRKLPDLPEGNDFSPNGSSSSNNKTRPRAKSQAARSVSGSPSRTALEKASIRNETHYRDHPANRSAASELHERALAAAVAYQLRKECVRAKKQRDIAHLKGLNIAETQPGKAQALDFDVRGGEEPQQHTSLSGTGTVKGSLKKARQRSESLLPAPLDLSKVPSSGPSSASTGNGYVPKTSTSSSVTAQTWNGTRSCLPASSQGSGNENGTVRHARKRSKSLSPKMEASSMNSLMLQNSSLRAAATALSSIVLVGEAKPRGLKNNSHVPLPTPSQGESKLVKALPPLSPRRHSPPDFATISVQGGLDHPAQTLSRSPSPSLQSSDEEGSLNEGRTTGTGTSLKSLPRSQTKPSTKPTEYSQSKVKSRFVALPVVPPQIPQRKSSKACSHSQTDSKNSASQASQNSHPPPSHFSDSSNTRHTCSSSETVRAAITAFEIHRANRRQERNRILRERRASEIACNKERAIHDEAVLERLSKGEERQEDLEERLKRVEERSVDMTRKYELMMKIARDLEDMKIMVRNLNGGFNAGNDVALVPGRGLASMSPVIGKMGNRGAKGQKEEACPQYEGYGESDSLGGGLAGRSSTPIGSLIEDLQSSFSASVGRHRD